MKQILKKYTISILEFVLVFIFLTQCSSMPGNKVVNIPMEDGIKLSTLLEFPPINKEHYPVVLIRTPYKKEMLVKKYNYLVQNGYVLVVQDVRGRFASGGEFEPFVKESRDGYQTINWIAKQPWCDGNIGMIGTSYDAWTAYCTAVEQPPNLKTIIANCGVVDLFYDLPYQYGIFKPSSLVWSKIIENKATTDITGKKIQDVYALKWDQLLNHLPLSDLDKKVFQKKLPYYEKWVQHETKDNYWKQGCTLEKTTRIKIPVFIQSGWFDSQLLGSKLAYYQLTKSGNKFVKMIIGPWAHTDTESNYHNGECMEDAAIAIDLRMQYVRWFDYWLKHKENNILSEPMVQLYALESNKWYHNSEYPFQNTSEKKFFLSSSGKLNLNTFTGQLITDSTKVTDVIDTYIYNPADIQQYLPQLNEQPQLFQKLLANRNDLLFYKTSAFKQNTTILGPISAKLYASSSAPDTDWYILLMLMDNKDNFIKAINCGMIRAKFRNSMEDQELLEKNEVYGYTIDMSHYGLMLKKGQKLGIVVTSSLLYPYLGKNLNTGKNNQTETDFIIAKQSVYHTDDYKSYISIQLLNYSDTQ